MLKMDSIRDEMTEEDRLCKYQFAWEPFTSKYEYILLICDNFFSSTGEIRGNETPAEDDTKRNTADSAKHARESYEEEKIQLSYRTSAF